jgi:hypothetical protein
MTRILKKITILVEKAYWIIKSSPNEKDTDKNTNPNP